MPSLGYRVLFVLGFSLFLAGCKQPDVDPFEGLTTDQIAIVQALNKSIAPIQDADPNRDFTDLTPLDTILTKAQVVGMGEGTHGTREFFQMKDRLFRYMVQKHGIKAIGFEANFGRSVIVNRFIHGQTTNLASASVAAKSMYFWTWSTEEVRDLLQWMKDYNVGKPGDQQLSFYGFDCQYADDEWPLIYEFLAKVEPTSLPGSDSLASLYNRFVANETKWAAAGGRENYEIARQAVRVLIQQADITNGDVCNTYIKRDMYMAENVQWMLTRMHVSKASLWAHNYHISNIPYANCSQPSMGGYLKQLLKDKYLTICTFLTNGSFTVRDASKNNSPLSQLSVRTGDVSTSFNNLLGKTQYSNFMLNLNQPGLAPALTNWLGSKHPLFETGAAFDETRPEQYYSVSTLTGRFDILFHFRDTSPSKLLP
ncbi:MULTISPECIES: erythromycin esterase family protein [unclassified Spirosoma]|uniref:erythromycin esterase family protein n=1 Tax=unclassified Spirosoma TaxID=2621999 RepID=UPI000AFD3030|nr:MULTISPECIES: erythromycin esterase family protein [unclassified Spirosoma]MBN8826163.1 erythromycin esterase family protein [Spirosoma sp.]